ncbi:hypothetical protein vseg_011088 [Gypsophila vaccaria]
MSTINQCLFLVSLSLVFAFVLGDLHPLNFTQKLDHFSTLAEEITFQQTVVVDDSHWEAGRGPFLVYLGDESGMYSSFDPSPFPLLETIARETKALIVCIEHRFYGQSKPFGSIEKAMADHRVRACLTIEQTLEDYKTIILSLKQNISAKHSPVVVFGSGYVGVLAAYFQVKYPNVTVGAFASSAPVLLIGTTTPQNGYCSVVSKVFEAFDRTCYNIINGSWAKLDSMAAQPNGLTHLSKLFKRCRPLKSVEEIKLELAKLYSFAAQKDYPWMDRVCDSVRLDSGDLTRVVEALTSTLGYEQCYRNKLINLHSPFDDMDDNVLAWDWQRCNEVVFPVGCDQPTMLPSRPFNMTRFESECGSRFGITPNFDFTRSYFGHKDIKEVLKNDGSNIIFSNGHRDPFSTAGCTTSGPTR